MFCLVFEAGSKVDIRVIMEFVSRSEPRFDSPVSHQPQRRYCGLPARLYDWVGTSCWRREDCSVILVSTPSFTDIILVNGPGFTDYFVVPLFLQFRLKA